ncbi:MAG TPA: glycosyltransferase family 4 protein [Candidatus Polarisedimenticolaceae bacterium]
MRILYASQYFPPEMGAPAARVSALARRWAARGHDVTVLTAFPNHPTGVIPPEYRGEIRRLETWHGARVVRTFVWAAANKGVLKRGIAYASWAASAIALGHGPAGRPDLVLATSPQFLVALSGWALSRLKGVPFVLEVRDLWPDSIVAVGALPPHSPAIRALRRLERFVYGQADLVVSVTRSFVPHLRSNGARRVAVIPNGADPEQFRVDASRDALRERYGLGDRFVAVFAGTLGMAHGLETVIDAAERLRDDPRFLFWLVGEGARRSELEAEAARRGLTNVRFEGQVDRSAIPGVLAAADASLVLLRPTPLFETVLPSKMFEAMAAGCPIVLGVRGEACEVLETSGGGIAIPPGDADALVAALRRLAADPVGARRMAERGRAFVAREYSHEAMAERYERELLELLRDLRG